MLLRFNNIFLSNHHGFAQLALGALSSYDTAPAPVSKGWPSLLTEEEQHVRPGHHWLFEFGDAGDGTSCEKEFTRLGRQGEVYTGTRFFNGDRALVVKRWLHRVDEDASGLTFVEPGTDC